MRKLNVLEFVPLGASCKPRAGPEEDTSGGFGYGGWTRPTFRPGEWSGHEKQMNIPFLHAVIVRHSP